VNSPDKKTGTTRTVRWKWYYYYFILAAFDVTIIIASLLLYNQTLNSYELALHKLGKIHAQLRSVAALRLGVVALNTPGNNVFASHQIDLERQLFEQAKQHLPSLIRTARETKIDLTETIEHINALSLQSRDIFNELAKPSTRKNYDSLAHAAASMAAMDNHLAATLTSLTEVEQHALMRIDSILVEYGLRLASYSNIQSSMLAVVIVILLGVFWYGRKLQSMHELMMADQRIAQSARKERLATVGQLCAGVAHGIRNPLAAIMTSAQLGLSMQNVKDDITPRLDDIVEECRRLNHRLTRLLDFARGASDLVQTYDFPEAISQAYSEIYEMLNAAGITINITTPNQPLMVRGDRERMVRAFIEIFSNVVEHTNEGCTVTVTFLVNNHQPPSVEVVIADTGPGIDQQVHKQVFDLFFTTTTSGTGIGLAVVKDAVITHGGEILIDNSTTHGATLRMQLPLA